MQNPEPIRESRKSLRIHGPARQGEDSLGEEKRSYVDNERGLVEEEDTHLIICASCGRAIRSHEEVGGLCGRCFRLLDRTCADETRCSHPQCGQVYCKKHSMYVLSKYWCNKHGWESLLKPFLLGIALLLLVTITASLCNALS